MRGKWVSSTSDLHQLWVRSQGRVSELVGEVRVAPDHCTWTAWLRNEGPIGFVGGDVATLDEGIRAVEAALRALKGAMLIRLSPSTGLGS